VTATSTTSAGATGRTDFISTVDQEVSGSKTYVVKALVAGTVLTGASVSHSIASGATAHTAPAAYTTVALTPTPTFIWSDEALTPHTGAQLSWNDDYLVKNIPTDSLTLTK
jgi:hypothetical protein